jgi:3-phenylpropionate/trans-cinnamate dioxygenase ferredoxin reductase subunit
LIVVGSGPAGVSAAEAFRRGNAELPIRILTADTAWPYARPPLSKEFLRGEDGDVELHPAQWYEDRSIEVSLREPVERIDTAERAVLTRAGRRYPYRSLVLATGSSPATPPVPGGEVALQLRSMADAVRLRDAAVRANSAVVIGAGFIGCEAAASLAMQSVATTLVAPEPVPQAARLGAEAGRRIIDLLADVGVRYGGPVAVTGIEAGAVHLDNGVTIDVDLVLAATGVTPQSALAADAGIATAEGRIVVDEHMRTSIENVYAAGDAAFAFNPGAGRRIATEHWQDAVDQGAVAGRCAAGGSAGWDGVPGFWTTIGTATLKYHAWGDGYGRNRLIRHGDRGFTVWYEADGAAVGVLTLNADDDYDRAEELIAQGKPPPVPME